MNVFARFALGAGLGLVLAASATADVPLRVTAGNKEVKTYDRRTGQLLRTEQVPGAGVVEVFPDGPAARLEVRAGDQIRCIVTEGLGMRRVDHMNHLLWVVAHSTAEPTAIYVVRNGQLLKLWREQVTVYQDVATTNTTGTGKPVIKKVPVQQLVPRATPAREADLAGAKPAEDPKP